MSGDREFVIFDAEGSEVESIDQYVSLTDLGDGVIMVHHAIYDYPVAIPAGGRYEIREMDR